MPTIKKTSVKVPKELSKKDKKMDIWNKEMKIEKKEYKKTPEKKK